MSDQTEAIAPNGDVVPFGTPGSEGPIELHNELPIGEKYDIALSISCPVLASQYFEACVAHTMKTRGKTRKEAEAMERTTIAFVASSRGGQVLEKAKKLYGSEV
jgi:hypothetical protein